MSELVALFRRSVEEFGTRVRAVGPDQWHLPTPCSEWDVHDLVNHLVNEERWAVPLLEGRTMEEVGDRFDGDLLGEHPARAWEEAARGALAATEQGGVLERTVHVSFGDISGQEYLSQLTTDHVIHAWDLARATGGDERLDPELVDFVRGYLMPQVEQWRQAGVFGAKVDPAPGADAQAELLALTGRSP